MRPTTPGGAFLHFASIRSRPIFRTNFPSRDFCKVARLAAAGQTSKSSARRRGPASALAPRALRSAASFLPARRKSP